MQPMEKGDEAEVSDYDIPSFCSTNIVLSVTL